MKTKDDEGPMTKRERRSGQGGSGPSEAPEKAGGERESVFIDLFERIGMELSPEQERSLIEFEAAIHAVDRSPSKENLVRLREAKKIAEFLVIDDYKKMFAIYEKGYMKGVADTRKSARAAFDAVCGRGSRNRESVSS